MKTSLKLTILLSALLLMTIVASVPVVFSTPSNNSALVAESDARPNAAGLGTGEKLLGSSFGGGDVEGATGSGWKPDVKVAGDAVDEVNPSMASYIDRVTGAVTLWVAFQRWYSYPGSWGVRLYKSVDRGASWSYFWEWYSGRSVINPSIAVSPYNGTVFVALQRTAYGALTNDIAVYRLSPVFGGGWTSFDIDVDADDDRNPQLVSEYSYGSLNYLYVSYEYYYDYDDRDLCLAKSTDWGKTWIKKVLRGGWDDPFGLDRVGDVFTESDITFAQGNLYIACRHSEDYTTTGRIDISYSKDITYGVGFGTWTHMENATGVEGINARRPSIEGSHVGLWHKPATLWIAFENITSPIHASILVSWSKDYGDTWSIPETIAGTSPHQWGPQLSVDGMGTESRDVPGRFHLVYVKFLPSAIYYTQVAWFEPSYAPARNVYYYFEGWSTPQGQIIDINGYPIMTPTITAFKRTVGAETLWVPGVAWTDHRNAATAGDDVYFTTLDTMFSVTFYPSSQTVVAGGSLSYYVTVNLISGATATATLDITGPYTYHAASAHIWGHSFSPPTITPTGTSLLIFNTANYIGPGTYYFNASAVIGGYRRWATIPFTVTAAPTLTLNISPSTVARGQKLTISGQLTPGMVTTINIYYRYPHATGSWALATTLPTNAAGVYNVTATVPNLTPGIYDLIAVWFNPANGQYAPSPIRVLTIT